MKTSKGIWGPIAAIVAIVAGIADQVIDGLVVGKPGLEILGDLSFVEIITTLGLALGIVGVRHKQERDANGHPSQRGR